MNTPFDVFQVSLIIRVGKWHWQANLYLLCIFKSVIYNQHYLISELHYHSLTVKKESASSCQVPAVPSLIMGLQWYFSCLIISLLKK